MKSISKKALAILMAAGMLLSLTGCSDNNDPQQTGNAVPEPTASVDQE